MSPQNKKERLDPSPGTTVAAIHRIAQTVKSTRSFKKQGEREREKQNIWVSKSPDSSRFYLFIFFKSVCVSVLLRNSSSESKKKKTKTRELTKVQVKGVENICRTLNEPWPGSERAGLKSGGTYRSRRSFDIRRGRGLESRQEADPHPTSPRVEMTSAAGGGSEVKVGRGGSARVAQMMGGGVGGLAAELSRNC